jgi:hypothetical protein
MQFRNESIPRVFASKVRLESPVVHPRYLPGPEAVSAVVSTCNGKVKDIRLIASAATPAPRASSAMPGLDHNSLIIYTITISSILYFQRNTTGAALISSKYW